MSRLYLPFPKGTNPNLELAGSNGNPMYFSNIQQMSVDFRNKMIRISQFLAQQNFQDQLDLTDQCIAIHLDSTSIEAIKNSGFSSFIALVGLDGAHFTISLLGADETNPSVPTISPRYQTDTIYGYETWPRRGVLGLTKDFNDVLNCK